MSLLAKLEQIRKGFESQAPAEALALMARRTEELVQSGQAERALKASDMMPAFALNNTRGEEIRSEAVLARGPLILSFFRGHW